MACSSDVVKKVMRFKLQLTDTAESATVLKILQKLKDLDITLDILAETGIGKTVNSLRRHEQAGEFAKTLVRGWKKLLSKDCRSHADDGDVSETMSGKDQNCAGSLTVEDSNNNCLTSHSKSQDFSDEALFKIESRKTDSEKQQFEEHKGKNNENQEKQCVFERHILEKKVEVDKIDNSFVTKKKKNGQSDKKSGNCDTLPGNRKSEDTHLRAKSDSWEKMKINSDSGRFELEKELDQKLKQSKESSKERKETFSFESSDKYSETLKLANVRDDDSSGILRSFDTQRRENKKTNRHVGLKYKEESENEGDSKHKNKKAKMKHKGVESKVDQEMPSLSFESCLNYDVKVYKRKERCGVKKPSKKIKTVKEANKYPGVKTLKSPVTSINISPPKVQESVMDLMNTPLPVVLPDYEKPSSVERFDRKVERESDFCDVSEESAVFTGQRLNRKMQVYSGAKTIFLPTMMSLSQQCIRTLQNNINLLYETGGVPFEILEPVLERCTPGQLLRIEECNPIYIGVTDHLWGKHCQRDFKDSKLQEYESWKEMYVRLSEERERKFKRLTKSIVSAHSNKPKGRQVKMAFIHTVAKPPRDVRIQQEIHGTAVQQPPQPRCSVKVQEEKVRSSSSSAAGGNTQDPRKKTRVAPMMAKSLKAFKKQLGRR